MPRVTLTKGARRDARDARFWLRDREPKTVEGFRLRLEEARETLSEFPRAGQEYLAGTRRLPLTPYPYYLVYQIFPDRISILAVAHSSRQEGYWRER